MDDELKISANLSTEINVQKGTRRKNNRFLAASVQNKIKNLLHGAYPIRSISPRLAKVSA